MARNKKGVLLYGVGKSKPIQNASSFERKARKTWGGMLERCYSLEFIKKHPTYVDCVVCEAWHDFECFYEWYKENYVKGFFLDKDLTVLGNKVYSPSTCVFIPRWLNNILLDSKASRGIYPIGVTYDKGRYKARFSCDGVSTYLGLYESVLEASNAYNVAKGNYLLSCLSRHDVPEQVKLNLKKVAIDLLGGY